jgi:signal peptidase II
MAAESRIARAFRSCRTLVFVSGVSIHLLLLDQFAKFMALKRLDGTPGIEVIPGFFNLYLVRNRGCAWGLFQGSVLPLAAFAVVALAFLVWKRKAVFGTGRLAFWTETLLYAGIVGNLIDRLFLGCVIDFLDFHWYSHHFPVFNLADVYISVAAGLLVIAALFAKSGKRS